MDYTKKTILLGNGKACTIRRAEEADAELMVSYLKTVAGETPYLIREPEEITVTPEKEREFIRQKSEAGGELLLLAFVDGELAGNCSVSAVSSNSRTRHRCAVAIALYRAFYGMGIGTVMMEELLAAAQAAGYEQAELEVVSTNNPAISLYWKLGFAATGTMPQALKYQDGSYADLLFMLKNL